MDWVASVCPSFCPLITTLTSEPFKSHYQSRVFVCELNNHGQSAIDIHYILLLWLVPRCFTIKAVTSNLRETLFQGEEGNHFNNIYCEVNIGIA